jgi:hypothetical protein
MKEAEPLLELLRGQIQREIDAPQTES